VRKCSGRLAQLMCVTTAAGKLGDRTAIRLHIDHAHKMNSAFTRSHGSRISARKLPLNRYKNACTTTDLSRRTLRRHAPSVVPYTNRPLGHERRYTKRLIINGSGGSMGGSIGGDGGDRPSPPPKSVTKNIFERQ